MHHTIQSVLNAKFYSTVLCAVCSGSVLACITQNARFMTHRTPFIMLVVSYIILYYVQWNMHQIRFDDRIIHTDFGIIFGHTKEVVGDSQWIQCCQLILYCMGSQKTFWYAIFMIWAKTSFVILPQLITLHWQLPASKMLAAITTLLQRLIPGFLRVQHK